MVSEWKFDNILTTILAENARKISEIVIMVYFDGFSAKSWVKYHHSSSLVTYLESPHQGNYFRPPI